MIVWGFPEDSDPLVLALGLCYFQKNICGSLWPSTQLLRTSAQDTVTSTGSLHKSSRGLVVRDRGVAGLRLARTWPCVGAQVKYGSHVVIWTACKVTHNQYETTCGLRHHRRERLHASGSISKLRTRLPIPGVTT